MKFFGNIEEGACDEIVDAVGKAASEVKPFSLAVKGLGAFPNTRNPRVIWVGVEDSGGALRPLQGAIEERLGEIGYPREEREFKAHLTLGRARSGRGRAELLHPIEDLYHVVLGEFRVERLVLFKSDLKPTGPIYTELRAVKLGGG